MTRVRRVVATVVCGLVLLGGASACGDEGIDDRGHGDDGGPSTPHTTTGDPAVDPYLGLSKRAAIARAEREGRLWRIVREDDERFVVTLDHQPDRLNFEVDDGIVTKVTLG